jgi:hypothetical protein
MTELFDEKRTYILGDPELEILGTREKLAQWRHRNVGPAWVKLGRKVAYIGSDLNAYISAQRVDPNGKAA